MRRFIPQSLNQWLLAIAPLSLGVAWLMGYWTFGTAVALGALCVLAVRNPQREFILRWPWLARWLREQAPAASPTVDSIESFSSRRNPGRPVPDQNASLVEQMVGQGRVALLLRPQIAASLSASDLQLAQNTLDDAMAMVPEGQVAVRARCYDSLDEEAADRAERLIHVEGLFLDRFTVTNREYLAFVAGGGYEQMSLWDEAIWPAVLGFVDRTGQPGPRYWENGTYPNGKDDHPVVGVSWFEASAYARWAGKRLPTDPEWVKAATWPVFAEGNKPTQRRFPWGEAMDRKRANIWGSGHDAPVAVHALPGGASVNGVEQLIGNVWQWTSSSFGAREPAGHKIETSMPLKSIRGGAFDTYFETQAHCQFQSGESPLARKHNIGFRCAVGFCDVAQISDPAQSQPFDEAQAEDTVEVLA